MGWINNTKGKRMFLANENYLLKFEKFAEYTKSDAVIGKQEAHLFGLSQIKTDYIRFKVFNSLC